MTWLALILTLLGSSSSKEPTGAVAGRVVDKATQAGLPGASVIVVGTKKGTMADLEGRFRIEGLPAGVYNLEFRMIGYKPLVKNRVVVRPGRTTFLEVELEEQPILLKTIEVKPSFFEEVKDAPVSSKRMDFEEIRAQAGAGWDVQRAVQALPSVVPGPDLSNEVIVRGGNYGENLFVLDGMEIPNPNHFGWQRTGGGAVCMLNTDYISHVEFMAGAFPARYGDRASSVLVVEMKDGDRKRFGTKLGAGMAGAGGSLEGPLPGRKGSFWVSGHKSYLSFLKSSFGMTAVPYYWNLQGKLAYEPSGGVKLTLEGIYGNDHIRIEEEDTGLRTVEKLTVDHRTYRYALGGTLRSLLGEEGYVLCTLYRDLNYWWTDVVDSSGGLYFNRSIEDEDVGKVEVFYRTGIGGMSAGAYGKRVGFDHHIWMRPDTLKYYTYDDSGEVVDTAVVLNMGKPYVYAIDVLREARSWKWGGYLQLRRDVGQVTVTLGLRYDKFAYTGQGCWSPRTSLVYHLSPLTDLRAAYGRHYQFPDYYYLTAHPENRHLKAKYTDQVVVGVRHLFTEDVLGTVEVYYKRYRDVPIWRAYTTPDPNDWDRRVVNRGRGYSKGIEVFLHKKVKRALWGTLSYSYSLARAEDPRYPGREFPWDFDFRHILTILGGYRKDLRGKEWYGKLRGKWWYKVLNWTPFVPGDETEVSFRWRYTGGRPYTPMTYHREWRKWTLDEDQPINSARVPPYRRLDVSIVRRWFAKGWSIVSYWEVDNILNRKNIWDYQYRKDGTRKEIYQFGRMVVGGMALEF